MGRRILFVVLLGAIIAAATFDIWQFMRPAAHILPGVLDAAGTYTHTEQGSYYKIEASYPNRTGLWRFWKPGPDTLARSAIESWLQSNIEEFKNNIGAGKLTPQQHAALGSSAGQYSYTAQYKHFSGAGDKIYSYEYDIYVDSGGAHPNSYFKTFDFDPSGKQLALSDLFVHGSDYLDRIASSSLSQITEDLKKRLGADLSGALFRDGLAPKDSNFTSFVVDGGDLVLLFPPYQVAAYAAGDFTVRIPFSSLSDTLRPEWK